MATLKLLKPPKPASTGPSSKKSSTARGATVALSAAARRRGRVADPDAADKPARQARVARGDPASRSSETRRAPSRSEDHREQRTPRNGASQAPRGGESVPVRRSSETPIRRNDESPLRRSGESAPVRRSSESAARRSENPRASQAPRNFDNERGQRPPRSDNRRSAGGTSDPRQRSGQTSSATAERPPRRGEVSPNRDSEFHKDRSSDRPRTQAPRNSDNERGQRPPRSDDRRSTAAMSDTRRSEAPARRDSEHPTRGSERPARNSEGYTRRPSRSDAPRGGAARSDMRRNDTRGNEMRSSRSDSTHSDTRSSRPDTRSDSHTDTRSRRTTSVPPPDSHRDSAANAAPHSAQTPRINMQEGVRLSKRMSEEGLASRREADQWIERGWVKVDGQIVAELGTRVLPTQQITVDERARNQQAQQVTILLNKPVGYVSGQAEDGHLPAVTLIKPENHWAEDTLKMRLQNEHLRGLAPAGRLDIDSVGLLVLTQNGRVAKQLIGANSSIDKEYLVRVKYLRGEQLPEDQLALLNHGLELDGVPLQPARVEWQNEDQLRFVLREGKKRQIRRMCEMVGLEVLGLKRVRIGRVRLGGLPTGQWRYLGPDEIFWAD